ncbi:alpha/beta hydrolase family protein [Actinoplanes sp. TRM 88003]|uniref:Alpha/beta hydrolase family protein n=1 Tax=Paractinoplanes aksuensis TaxID=2939490 RepID=A0ABT1DTF4_9ACTN|nr:alpha/beta hydrolase [Actinoplanes aksuensis]MCO8273793.1 alpha/beta hydrolase family protein [Actinoplanes aksuensis]
MFGDLTTARRIAVLVPGMSNRLDNFWRGTGSVRRRSPAVQAADLHRAGDGAAVIAWLGYDAPQTWREAAREDRAEAGADSLVRFVTGLVTVRPDATITLLGHSYGSTVIGRAAGRLPRQVTDIAVFGSPGVGADTAAGLGTSARVWAGLSTRDWVRRIPAVRAFGLGHGHRPTDPAFGARVFATLDVAGHDHYLEPGTDSLAALARITEGGA